MIPGYSGIKQYGHYSFLAMALGFVLLVDAFLIVNYYWTALITPNQRNVLLVGLVGIWFILSLVASYRKHQITSLQPEEHDETFRQAICHYLRRDWFTAEAQILLYLKKFPKDVEMLLLQAAIYRRSERYEEALLVLEKLQLLQDSRYWYTEIESERSSIFSAQHPPVQTTEQDQTT